MGRLSARQVIVEGILAARGQADHYLVHNFNDLPNNIAAVAAGTLFEQILNRRADYSLGVADGATPAIRRRALASDTAMWYPPSHVEARLRLCPGQQGHDTGALQAYLGHKNIQHTVRYTELSPGRFKDFWR